MRIVFVNSSYRGRKGLSNLLIEQMVSGAKAANADCDIVNLSERHILHCQACNACLSTKSSGKCVHRNHDDVHAIFQLIAQADIVVYSTPVYVFGISSLLKILFERFYSYSNPLKFALSNSGLFFHDIPNAICSKPFVSLVCCDNFETQAASNCKDYFRTLSRFHDAKWLCHIVRNTGHLLTTENDLPTVRKQQIFEAFERVGHDLGRFGLVRRSTRSAASRELIPIPWFRYLKNLRCVKKAILKRALATQRNASGHGPLLSPDKVNRCHGT